MKSLFCSLLVLLTVVLSYYNVDAVNYKWQWVGGSMELDQLGFYPQKVGFQKENNTYWPGSRALESSVVCPHHPEMSYHFAGHGFTNMGWPINGFKQQHLNEMWRYDAITMEWTLLNSHDKCGIAPSMDGKMDCSIKEKPSGRQSASMVIDDMANIWIYGGSGYGVNCDASVGLLEDLWRFDTHINEWFYMAGGWVLNRHGDYPASAGSPASLMYYPGGRFSHSAVFHRGQMVLFGGSGVNSTMGMGAKNDLWVYSATSMKWMFVGGDKETGHCGNYDSNSVLWPSARSAHTATVHWNTMYMFGGNGHAKNSCGGNCGRLNELWMLNLISWEWSLLGGDVVVDGSGSNSWPSARAWHSMTMVGDSIMIGLGGVAAYKLSNQIWTYEVRNNDANAWERIHGTTDSDPMPMYPNAVMDPPSSSVSPGGRAHATLISAGPKAMLFGGIGEGMDMAGETVDGHYGDVWLMSSDAGCGGNDCHANGQCVIGVAGYSCMCNEGYRGNGRMCEVNHHAIVEQCEDCDCSPLDFGNGTLTYNSGGKGDIGDTVTFGCFDGYYLDLMGSKRTISCLDDGTGEGFGMWSHVSAQCRAVDCGIPTLKDGYFSVSGTGSATTGDVVEYACNDGFILQGTQSLSCTGMPNANGLAKAMWDGTEPTCMAQSCGMDTAPVNGVVKISGTGAGVTGEQLTYSCISGYRVDLSAGGTQHRFCVEKPDGSGVMWTGSKPKCTCSPMACPIENQQVTNGMSWFEGETINYKCNEGYVLDGKKTRTCDKSGSPWVWLGDRTFCVMSKCPSLKVLRKDGTEGLRDPNAQVVISGTGLGHPGETATYTCNAGYTLFVGGTADTSRICGSKEGRPSKWSGQEPFCLEIGTACPGCTDAQGAQIAKIVQEYTLDFYSTGSGADLSGISMFGIMDGYIVVDMMVAIVIFVLIFGCCCLSGCIKKMRRKRALKYARNVKAMRKLNNDIELA